MTRVRRLAGLLLAVILVLATSTAYAQQVRAAPDDDVTSLTPPPVPPPTNPVAGLAAPPDLSAVLGRPLVARDIAKQRERMEAMLKRRGFQAPRVSITTRPTDDPQRVVVIVDIDPGAPRRIERRVVYRFDGTLAEAEAAERTYAVKIGDR